MPVQVVENHQWSEGMGTSIRAGVTALVKVTPNLDAVIITVCDQPFIYAGIIKQLIHEYLLTDKYIVAAKYADTLGVPALFSRAVFLELMNLPTNAGAKHIIQKYPHSSVLFPAGVIDIDTPSDYEKLQTMTDKSYKI